MSTSPSQPPNKLFSRAVEVGFFMIWTAITVLLSYWLGQKSYSWMPPQATVEAEKVDRLFSFLVTLGSAIFLGVFGMIGHSVLVCRAQPGDFSEGHPVRSNTAIEVLWTGIPILLVLWIAVQGFQVYSLLDLKGISTFASAHPSAHSGAAMVQTGQVARAPTVENTIEVTAKQWAWSFRYLDQDITANELHLPVNQPVRLVLESADVLHGFYVPAFRIKQDMIPNRAIDFVFSPSLEGKYRLNDSQFSGTFFALMAADVYVENEAAYQQWRSQLSASPQPPPMSDLAAAERANPPNLWGQRWAVPPSSENANLPTQHLPTQHLTSHSAKNS